ncbi:maleylpyruvate isomerase family mycothiol-dependent enzyme [Actinomycetospora atypica]|uniref:Maleylpyruvate isomerase family mycothiol-dependent enzyme n=1 Tax=Actinomycetospora atypica TaxID=1290095 RepID=A0ABV9YNI8_9PSEU
MLTDDEALTAVRRCWTSALDHLEGLPDEAWAGPTRCTGWTVLDLARHAAWGTSMEADALRRSRTREPGSGEGIEPADDVLAALRGSVADLVGELERADELGAAVEIPFGAVPTPFALQVFTMEAGFHADDVAAALGHDEPLGHDVVRATAAVLPPVFPVLAGAAAAEPPADGTVIGLAGTSFDLRFGFLDGAWQAAPDEPLTATIAGSDTAVLRFALGRAGLDGLAVTGDADLAAGFKTWFMGP